MDNLLRKLLEKDKEVSKKKLPINENKDSKFSITDLRVMECDDGLTGVSLKINGKERKYLHMEMMGESLYRKMAAILPYGSHNLIRYIKEQESKGMFPISSTTINEHVDEKSQINENKEDEDDLTPLEILQKELIGRRYSKKLIDSEKYDWDGFYPVVSNGKIIDIYDAENQDPKEYSKKPVIDDYYIDADAHDIYESLIKENLDDYILMEDDEDVKEEDSGEDVTDPKEEEKEEENSSPFHSADEVKHELEKEGYKPIEGTIEDREHIDGLYVFAYTDDDEPKDSPIFKDLESVASVSEWSKSDHEDEEKDVYVRSVVWNDPKEMGVPEDAIPEFLLDVGDKVREEGFEIEFFKFQESNEFNGFYLYSFSEDTPDDDDLEFIEKQADINGEVDIGEWKEYEDSEGTFYVAEVVFKEGESGEDSKEPEEEEDDFEDGIEVPEDEIADFGLSESLQIDTEKTSRITEQEAVMKPNETPQQYLSRMLVGNKFTRRVFNKYGNLWNGLVPAVSGGNISAIVMKDRIPTKYKKKPIKKDYIDTDAENVLDVKKDI